MTALFNWLHEVLLVTLRPPPNSPTSTVRKAGATMMALGLLAFVGTVAIGIFVGQFNVHRHVATVLVVPFVFLSLGSIVIGAFRLVLAKDPAEVDPLLRIALGAAFGFGTLFLIPLLLLMAWFCIDQMRAW